MADQISAIKSEAAQMKAAGQTAKAGMKQGKALAKKKPTLNKAVWMHMLLFLLIGLFMGSTAFIPIFDAVEYSIFKLLFALTCGVALLLGIWQMRRMYSKIDWSDVDSFWPEFALSLSTALFFGLGLFAMYAILPMVIDFIDGNLQIAFLMASTAVLMLLPFLIVAAYRKALDIEPKTYRYWLYPLNYIEKQPTWDRERIVFANLHFRRKASETLITTVKVKLPKEANFGELIYLFIKDYNENRNPENPIDRLYDVNGNLGWLFSIPNSGIKAIFSRKRYVDADLTIEANKIQDDTNIFFERVEFEVQ